MSFLLYMSQVLQKTHSHAFVSVAAFPASSSLTWPKDEPDGLAG